MFLKNSVLFAALIVFAGINASAVVVNVATGQKLQTEQLLAQGKILVYVKSDCEPCRKYISRLQECSSQIDRIVFISLSSPAQTQKIFESYPRWQNKIYVMKGQNKPDFVTATPFTHTKLYKQVGILSCKSLAQGS